ncbi:hypothetical protein NFI96_029691, partial [Prochilodus magdalenae]
TTTGPPQSRRHTVTPSSTLRNLGVIFDTSLSFNVHISNTVRTAFFHLRNSGKLRNIHYIPPRANSATALGLLHGAISKQETAHQDAVFIVAGDFNHCNLRTVLPKYHQHVSCPTRENNILDQVYSNVRGGYKAAARPHFGRSDHIIPDTLDPLQFAYRQNRSTDDAVNTAIHTALKHLEGKDTYVRSAFNTVIPTKLAGKLLTLGLTPGLCNWVLNFLTDRP